MSNLKRILSSVKIPLLAVLIAIVVGGIIILFTGSNPFSAYYALLQGCGFLPKKSYGASFNMFTDFMRYIDFFTPMIFAALSVAVALKAGLFNIGVSGQMLAAGFTASVIVGYSELNPIIAKPLVVLIGIIVGGFVGGLVGYLKYRFNINEVVATIMFNYIIQYVCSFMINTYYVDPVSRQSVTVGQNSRLTLKDCQIGGLKVDIPLGLIIAIVAIILVKFLFDKSILGYELKMVGFSRTGADFAGVNVGKSMIIAMAISGILAGLAGVTYYLGYAGSIQPKVLSSTGYDAIAISLLGNNNPVGIIFSTMLISLVSNGSTYMKSRAGVESEIASVIIGIILIFSASNAYIKHRAAIKKANLELKSIKEDK